MNVGNREVIHINEFVKQCYEVVGTPLDTIGVTNGYNQRDYFCFYDCEYSLDIAEMEKILLKQKKLSEGLMDSYKWYCNNNSVITRKDYIKFIDTMILKDLSE